MAWVVHIGDEVLENGNDHVSENGGTTGEWGIYKPCNGEYTYSKVPEGMEEYIKGKGLTGDIEVWVGSEEDNPYR